AISLAQILRAAGHTVVGALVGVTPVRPVPAFFLAAFQGEIEPVNSPGLVYSPKTNELLMVKTMLATLRQGRTFARSIRQVRDSINWRKPDLVVNFYELLGGLTYARYRPNVPMICVAHQYLAFHPAFRFPAKKWLARRAFLGNSWLTSLGATQRLALSFDSLPDVPKKRVRVVPPLLRREVTSLKPGLGNYWLAYLTQAGLATRLTEAHRQHPEVPIRFFNPATTVPDEVIDSTLIHHQLDGQRFVEAMQHCRAVVTTAGFESVCEAFYLGKPVLMMPQPNHYEQICNALDGQRAGVGVASDTLDFDTLLNYLPQHDFRRNDRFRLWQQECSRMFLEALEQARSSKSASSVSASETSWSGNRSLLRLNSIR
ncbi:MAG: glycosyl transferase, partial [Rudanella sp.]|nr:glycosyl transferase [Rudanella sp.]